MIEGKIKEFDKEIAKESEVIPVDRKDNFRQDPTDQTYTQLRLSDILKKAGVSHTVEVGIIDKQSHMWVRVGKDTIIDPTASQFGRRLDIEDYNNAQE